MSFLYLYMPWSILLLRLALAAIFFVHGMPKVQKPEAMAGGVGMSAGTLRLVGIAEVAGAASMLFGLLSQIGSIAIAIVMIGALHYKINKWKVPFTAMDKMGWEFDLILLASALVILTTGPGPLSLDWMLLGGY